MKDRTGFTLIELLVVISIISLLSSVVLSSLSSARQRARDAQRLSDMRTIQTALELFYSQQGRYPSNDEMQASRPSACGGWAISNQEYLFSSILSPFLGGISRDPVHTGCNGYRYHRYAAGNGGCPASNGEFYVLGITDLERTSGRHPNSPGFSCPLRNWSSEFEWVVGRFER
jgi:prepilin-type N-terminal cleavage/methylation domain-containing protein